MQYSDTSTNQGIIQDITFLTGQDTNAYTLNDRTRNVNRHYLEVVNLIIRASGAWEFDDTGKTDHPVLTSTLVDGQSDYELPKSVTSDVYTKQGDATKGGILKIHRVEVLDSNSVWSRLKQIDQREVRGAWDEFQKTDGLPRFYDIRGGSIFLKPAPATGTVTLSGGLKIYILREPYVFTASDTTREPGFAEIFHRRLSLGASYDWFMANVPERATSLKAEIMQMDEAIKEFYGSRDRDYTPRLIPKRPMIT